MKERREHGRSPIEMAASYGMPEVADLTGDATVVNISEGGFCFETKKRLKTGDELTLNIEIEQGQELFLEVKIIWIKEISHTGNFMAGVRITKQKGKDYEKFIEFYDQKADGNED